MAVSAVWRGSERGLPGGAAVPLLAPPPARVSVHRHRLAFRLSRGDRRRATRGGVGCPFHDHPPGERTAALAARPPRLVDAVGLPARRKDDRRLRGAAPV